MSVFKRQVVVTLAASASIVVLAGVAYAQGPAWSAALKIDTINGNSTELNTTSLDGCPIQSPDGLSLYLASNRPGGLGGLDIWVATRTSSSAAWGAPANLGEPVNSASDDFCPTPVRGKGLFFVSREALPGACGQGDIYFTSRDPAQRWAEPQRLACAPTGPNTALDEQGPSFVDLGKRQLLYFSSSSVTPAVTGDVFVSARKNGARFGPAIPVTGLNDGTANDIQPNVRKDGLEVVFSSNRAGGAGAQDIWGATRSKVGEPWSAPINLGSPINTGVAETRPSLSFDGNQLLFGRSPSPEGMSDIYVSTR
jgi:hypothetical protein